MCLPLFGLLCLASVAPVSFMPMRWTPSVRSAMGQTVYWTFSRDSTSHPIVLPEIPLARIGPAGRLYVLTAGEKRLRIASSRGRVLKSFHFVGSDAPERATRFGLVGDSLWIWDRATHRLILMSDAVAWSEEMPGVREVLAFGPTGHFLYEPVSAAEDSLFVVRKRLHETKSDTIYRNAESDGRWTTLVFGSDTFTVSDPLCRCARVGSGGEWIVVTEEGTLDRSEGVRLRALKTTGEATNVRSLPLDRVAIDEAAARRVFLDDLIRELGGVRGKLAWARRLDTVPLLQRTSLPLVTRVLIGADESIWLELPVSRADSTAYLVLSSDGRILRGIYPARPVNIVAVGRDIAWIAEPTARGFRIARHDVVRRISGSDDPIR